VVFGLSPSTRSHPSSSYYLSLVEPRLKSVRDNLTSCNSVYAKVTCVVTGWSGWCGLCHCGDVHALVLN
jgi:hypothetical protein